MSKCPYNPVEMAGKPIGMYHCPECGEMVIAGVGHPDYSVLEEMEKEDDRVDPPCDDKSA